MTEDQVAALERHEEDPQFSDRQKAALRLAEYMFYDPHHLPQDLAADLRRLFTEEEVIELVWTTGHFIGVGKVVLTLGMERAAP